jgi:predicted alpha-1,6-mannanase (GH76 family)
MRRAVVCALVLQASACGSAGAGSVSDAGVDGSTDATAPDGSDAATPLLDSGAAFDAPSVADAGVVDAAGEGGADASAALQAHARADDAVEAMLLSFWDPKQQYLDATQGTTTLTGYWTEQQAWDAVLDAVERHPGGTRFTGTLATFYDVQNTIGWPRNYYDDENWATLALIRAYDLTGNTAYLTQAETLYANIMAAWDTTCCGASPGGVWWDTAHTQKATASNAGPVVSGARLYQRTKNMAYLTFAQQVFTYWSANMVDPTTYQVTDHITSAGQKVAWKFTYNEGLMIGAAVALAQATGDASSLALAEHLASFVESSETEVSSLGVILTDGTDTTCTGDCMQFKGIAARYLATLYQGDPGHPEYLSLLTRSADAAWTIARDPSSRLYGADWGAPFVAPAQLNATSSAAMTLAAIAILEGSAPADPPGIYEAEESVLHSVGLEALHGSFDGWGYVAGWNADGQWVDFLVSVPTAGAYDLTFRYAAGAGDATRLVYVNGANAVANQSMPSTGSWDTYGTVKVTVSLPAGESTVSLIYNSSLGSTNYVNLDRLSVTLH